MKKKFLILILVCSCLLFSAITCTKETDTSHYYIRFTNASDYTIYVERSIDTDTSLSRMHNVMVPAWDLKIEPHSTELTLGFGEKLEIDPFRDKDTLVAFVFNADTLELYGWTYAKEHYLVHQRYHLTLPDLQHLDWRLSFPPTEEMRNIKMWPPYGTYDASGHRRD